MILKSFEIKKINQNINNLILFYGKNEGLKNEAINILVKDNGELVLIDYDSMYVDALNGYDDEIKGLPGYQHPERFNIRGLTPKADYFSQLIIYTGVLTFAERNDLWPKYKDTNDLIFSREDFLSPSNSIILNELKSNGSDKLKMLIEAICSELKKNNFESLLPLEDHLVDKRQQQIDDIFGRIDDNNYKPFKRPEGNKPDTKNIFDKM